MGIDEERTLLTVEDAAGILRLHPKTLAKYLRAGTFPGFKMGREWRVSRAALDRWVAEKHRAVVEA